MRTKALLTAALAILTATAAPAIAQSAPALQPSFTLAESEACMYSATAYMLIAIRLGAPEEEELYQIGSFWAAQADAYGDPEPARAAEIEAKLNTMLDQHDKMDPDAFLAPYEADFAQCEVKRKSVGGGV